MFILQVSNLRAVGGRSQALFRQPGNPLCGIADTSIEEPHTQEMSFDQDMEESL